MRNNPNKGLKRKVRFHIFTIWTAIITYPVIGLLDIIYYPKHITTLLLIRGAVVMYFALLLKLINTGLHKKLLKYYPILMMIPATWGMSYMSYYVGEGFSSPYFAGNMLIILALAVTLETTALEFGMLAFCSLPFHFFINSMAKKYVYNDMVANIFFLGLAFAIGAVLNLLTNRLRQKESMATENNEFLIKVFTHDVKNRMTILYMILDRIRNMSQDKNILKDLDDVIIEQDRISQMIKNLMNCFSMDDSLVIRKRGYSIDEIGHEIEQEWGFKFKNKNTSFTVDIQDHSQINMDYEYMKLAWNNVLSNCLQYSGSDGSAHVNIYKEDNNIVLSFKNSGKIIPVNFRNRVFDKYLRPEQHSPYSKGLGLHYTKLVVDMHGGTITYIAHEEEDAEEGNEFLIKIPA